MKSDSVGSKGLIAAVIVLVILVLALAGTLCFAFGNHATGTTSIPAIHPEISLTPRGNSQKSIDLTVTRLTPEELRSLSQAALAVMRNGFYAHHGYIFQNKQFGDYFKQYMKNYDPIEPNAQKVEATFNPVEEYNVNLIHAEEARRKTGY